MSYDFSDGVGPVEPPPRPPWTLRRWLVDKWWGFVIWAALDAKSKRLNNWGLLRLTGPARPVGQLDNTGMNKLLERTERTERGPDIKR